VVSRPPRVVVFGGDLRKLARDLAGLGGPRAVRQHRPDRPGRAPARERRPACRRGPAGLPRDPLGRPRRGRRDPQSSAAPSAWPAAASTASARCAAGWRAACKAQVLPPSRHPRVLVARQSGPRLTAAHLSDGQQPLTTPAASPDGHERCPLKLCGISRKIKRSEACTLSGRRWQAQWTSVASPVDVGGKLSGRRWQAQWTSVASSGDSSGASSGDSSVDRIRPWSGDLTHIRKPRLTKAPH
jgi:hypothetical protein